jgi:hypothetical protein
MSRHEIARIVEASTSLLAALRAVTVAAAMRFPLQMAVMRFGVGLKCRLAAPPL